MAAAAILKKTLPVEPPVWERNSWFVISNQNWNFVKLSWRLRVVNSRGSNAEANSAANRPSPKRVEMLVFSGTETPSKWLWRLQTLKRHVYETEHVVWAIKCANWSRIATCRRDEGTGKRRTKVTKPWYFTTVWRCPPVNRSKPNFACL